MKRIILGSVLIAAAFARADPSNYYNILSIDGGGAKGIIPATVIEKMEQYSMQYMKANYKEEDYKRFIHVDKNGKERKDQVHMTDLFDMLAGTSAGSLISSMLSVPISADN